MYGIVDTEPTQEIRMRKLFVLTLVLLTTGCIHVIPQHGVTSTYSRLMPGLELTLVNNSSADCLEITVSDGQKIECAPLGKPIQIYINRSPMGPREILVTASGKTSQGGYLGLSTYRRRVDTETIADTWVVNNLRMPPQPRITR